MIDTMTGVKIVGGFCGALLVFLLGAWAAEAIYHVGGGHGEVEQAYVIETGEEEETGEEVVEVDFAEVYAAADPAAGERIWRQCSACHRLEDGANATGPHLFGVVGRPIAAVDAYTYSSTLAELGDSEAWSVENLSGFLEDPAEWAPGTKMTFNGLDDAEDRADIIAYLESVGG